MARKKTRKVRKGRVFLVFLVLILFFFGIFSFVKQENTKEEPFTLEEYKMMLKVLKEEQMKEQIQEKSPLTELNKLYQSVEE